MIILVLYKGESGCDIYKQGIGQIDILWVNRLVIKFVLFNQLMIHLGEAANKVSWASVATPSSRVCVCVCVKGEMINKHSTSSDNNAIEKNKAGMG